MQRAELPGAVEGQYIVVTLDSSTRAVNVYFFGADPSNPE